MPPLFLEDQLLRTVARITNEHAVARAAAAVLLAAKKSTPLVFVRHGCAPTASFFFASSAPPPPRPPPPLPLALTPALQDALRRTPCRFCGAYLLRPEQIVWDERVESWAVAQGIVVPYDGPCFVHVDCLPKKPHVRPPSASKRLRHS